MEREKQVDESWKEASAKQKEILSRQVNQSAGESKLHVEPSIKQPEDQVENEPQDEFSQHEEPQHQEFQQQEEQTTQVNFLNYLTGLGFQAMVFLGEIPNPATNQAEKSLDHAKFMIDTLVMIREKTKGNLSHHEEDLLNASIYELQMKYVEAVKRENQA